MFTFVKHQKEKFLFSACVRLLVFVLSFSLAFSPAAAQAQSVLNLPIPGAMVRPSPAFVPVLLKGMTIQPDNPLKFDFIIDSGNTDFTTDEIRQESERLVKYFLASMTIPKDDLWVNLSPYEQDRIIPEELGKTELGRDMLAQDYILKQLTASLMYPEDELGKKFWDRVYTKAEEQFGTREIPVNTFNKVWILPETATVYEHEQTVYVVDAHLKVMLDSDYVAMEAQQDDTATSRAPARDQAEKIDPRSSILDSSGTSKIEHPASSIKDQESVSTQIIREIIIPEIEREVNKGTHFAPLRQIYHSLILAKWYKETVKNSLLSQVYADTNMTDGIESEEKDVKNQIYAQYMEAYKKGVFNYIKEGYDRLSNEMIPRKYFSGGEMLTSVPLRAISNPTFSNGNGFDGMGFNVNVEVEPRINGASSLAQSSSPARSLEGDESRDSSDPTNVKREKDGASSPKRSSSPLRESDNPQFVSSVEITPQRDGSWVVNPIEGTIDPRVYEKIFQEWENALMSANASLPIFMIGGHPGSGKSSLSRIFAQYLRDRGFRAEVIHADKLHNHAVVRFIKAIIKPWNISSLFNLPEDDRERERIKKYVNHVMINGKRVKDFYRKIQHLLNLSPGETAELMIPGRSTPDIIEHGTILIIEGVFVRDMFPELSPTRSTYFTIGQEQAESRLINKGMNKGWSYYRSKFEERLANLQVARDLYDPQQELYDYLFNVSEGQVTMERLRIKGNTVLPGSSMLSKEASDRGGRYSLPEPGTSSPLSLNKLSNIWEKYVTAPFYLRRVKMGLGYRETLIEKIQLGIYDIFKSNIILLLMLFFNDEIRPTEKAIKKLGNLQDPSEEIIDTLLEVILQRRWSVDSRKIHWDRGLEESEAARESLEKLGVPKDVWVAKFLKALGDERPGARSKALYILREQEDEPAVRATDDQMIERYAEVVRTLEESSANKGKKNEARKALGEFKDSRAVDVLIDDLKNTTFDIDSHTDTTVSDPTMRSLIRIGDLAVRPLVDILRDVENQNEHERIRVAFMLARIEGVEPVRRAMIEATEHFDDADTRKAYAEVISYLERRSLPEPYFPTIESSRRSDRWHKEAVAQVRSKLTQEDWKLTNTYHFELVKKFIQFGGELQEVIRISNWLIMVSSEASTKTSHSALLLLGASITSEPIEEEGSSPELGASSPVLSINKQRATSNDLGGIDLNEINVDRQGSGVQIQFDPVEIQEFIDMGITGFAPVIINITPLPSVLPLLGLAPKKEEEYEISQLDS